MKAGLATSVILHAAALAFGLLTLRAPAAFDVADVEALPVDIVPVESITQIQEGDKKATMRDKPAPTPTQTSSSSKAARLRRRRPPLRALATTRKACCACCGWPRSAARRYSRHRMRR